MQIEEGVHMAEVTDRHSSLYHPNADFNKCLIFIQNICKFLTSLPPRRRRKTFFKTFACFFPCRNSNDVQRAVRFWQIFPFVPFSHSNLGSQMAVTLFCYKLSCFLPPQGFRLPRAYIKESTYIWNIQSYRKNLDLLERAREESVGNDDVSIVCARKYEMVRMT